MTNKKQAQQGQLGAKLATMSYYECIEYIRKNIASTFGFLPKAYGQAFNDLLDKLEGDYKQCEEEKIAAIKERDELLAKYEPEKAVETEKEPEPDEA